MLRQALLLLLTGLIGCATGSPGAVATSGEVPSADGVMIHYDVRGTGEPALVLVHGWTNSRGIWGQHPDTLARTHRVVTLDLAGHGSSGADRRDWTIDAFGADVAAVVDELALPDVVLVGFSMGGGVVLEAAERLEERVLGIVLVDTFHDPELTLDESQAEQLKAAFRANWGDRGFLRAFGFSPDAPESLVEYTAQMMGEEPREHLFVIFDAYGAWMRSELKPSLQSLRVPIAAINTAHPPTNVEAMRRYAPTFRVDTIDDVGHAGILLRNVEEFDALLLANVEDFTAE